MEIIDELEVSRRGLYGGVRRLSRLRRGRRRRHRDPDRAAARRGRLHPGRRRDRRRLRSADGGPGVAEQGRGGRPGHRRRPVLHPRPSRTVTRWTSRGTALGVLLGGGIAGPARFGSAWFSASGTGGGPEGSISSAGRRRPADSVRRCRPSCLPGVLLTLVLADEGGGSSRSWCSAADSPWRCSASSAPRPAPPPSGPGSGRSISVDQFVLAGTGWPWLYLVAGLLVVGGAVLVWLGCPRWPRRGTRYERTTDVDATVVADDPASAWRALDAGVDPTLTGPSETPPEAVSESVPDTPSDAGPLGAVDRAPDQTTTPGFDPDVRSGVVRDTMGPGQDQSSRRQDGDQ